MNGSIKNKKKELVLKSLTKSCYTLIYFKTDFYFEKDLYFEVRRQSCPLPSGYPCSFETEVQGLKPQRKHVFEFERYISAYGLFLKSFSLCKYLPFAWRFFFIFPISRSFVFYLMPHRQDHHYLLKLLPLVGLKLTGCNTVVLL